MNNLDLPEAWASITSSLVLPDGVSRQQLKKLERKTVSPQEITTCDGYDPPPKNPYSHQ